MNPPDPPSKPDWDAKMAVGGKQLVILRKQPAAANSMLEVYEDGKNANSEVITPTAAATNQVQKQTSSLLGPGMTAPTEPLAMRNRKRTSVVPNVPTGPKAMRRRTTAAGKTSQGRKTEDGHLASRTAERREMAGSNYEDRVRLYKGSDKLKALQEAAESGKIQAADERHACEEADAGMVEKTDDTMIGVEPE